MTIVKDAANWLNGGPKHLRGVRILQVCIGAMILSRVFTETPFAIYLWGPDGLGYGSTQLLFGETVGGWFDSLFDTRIGVYVAMYALGVAALGLVLGVRTRICTVLGLFVYLLLEYRLPELGDGGDNIARLALCYMVFLLPAGNKAEPGSLRAWFHNLAVAAIAVQLMVMYFTSGMMKAHGEAWHNGTAIYVVSQVEWFSHPAIRGIFTNAVVATVVTYASMIFQIWFPVAMFSRFKLAVLCVGMSMHVGIALFMGLVQFSLVMIGLELFLITDGEWDRIFAAARRWKERVAERLRPEPDPEPSYMLFIDGHCARCRAIGDRIERLDRRDRIAVSSFRHEDRFSDHGITAGALERRMHMVELGSGAVHAGFDAVRALARAIPLLWFARPLLALAAVTRLGDRAYDAIASRRVIIPDSAQCDASCRVEGAVE